MSASKKFCFVLGIALSLLIVVSEARVAVAWVGPPRVLIDARTSYWDFFGRYSGAIGMLEANGYAVEVFTTGTITSSLLQGYDCLVIVVGDQGYSSSERDDIEAFVEKGGGGLVFLGEWGGKFTDPSAEVLATFIFGIIVRHDTLYDPTDYETNEFWPRIHTFPTPHPVTSGITVFTLGASATFDVWESPPPTLKVIATGDDDSYRADDPTGTTPDYAGDAQGTSNTPWYVSAAIDYSSWGGGKAVYFGDSSVFGSSAEFNGIARADNAKLWLNIFFWIAPTIEQVIPEVPFGTVMTALSMLIALVGFAGFKHLRPKF